LPFTLNGVSRKADERPGADTPRRLIPERLQDVYAAVTAKALELRAQGMTHRQVCAELNKLGYTTRTGQPWRHPQQIVKLLKSFGGTTNGAA
jgi:hypothetical protein